MASKKQNGSTFSQSSLNASTGTNAARTGTSIFDPVLCELMYRWFCPPGGRILDPFAGGSVRGIVAAKCGFRYHGNDLRAEQVDANRKQADRICDEGDRELRPIWTIGDSLEIQKLAGPGPFDMVFSCPPYGDLEVYSEQDGDLSNMEHAQFLDAYRKIIAASCAMLAPNRFAAFVVGDFRDKDGFLRNFVGDTIAAFLECGMRLYNEAILVTAIGSLPVRAGRQFAAGRKLGKTHQNILVFFNGNPASLKTWGEPDMGDWEGNAGAEEAPDGQ